MLERLRRWLFTARVPPVSEDEKTKISRSILDFRFSDKQNMLEVVQAYKAVLNTRAGKIVLNDLIGFTGVGTDPFTPGSDAETNYNLGRRRVGLRICDMIGTDETNFTINEKGKRNAHEQKQITGREVADDGKKRR